MTPVDCDHVRATMAALLAALLPTDDAPSVSDLAKAAGLRRRQWLYESATGRSLLAEWEQLLRDRSNEAVRADAFQDRLDELEAENRRLKQLNAELKARLKLADEKLRAGANLLALLDAECQTMRLAADASRGELRHLPRRR